jgi:hypothetical protein
MWDKLLTAVEIALEVAALTLSAWAIYTAAVLIKELVNRA